jgi:acetyl-CoA synthetase
MSEGAARGRLEAYRFYERDWEDYDQLRREFEFEVPEQFNLATYLCDRWVGTGRVALRARTVSGTETYTYSEIQRNANRLANYLHERGVGRGDRVAVNGAQRVESLVTHLAAWKLGAASVPLSVLFGPDALGFRLQDSEAVAYAVAPQSIEAFREVRADCEALTEPLIVGDPEAEADETAFWAALEGQPEAFETVETDPDETSMVLYTSGTTGEPKGVLRPHRGLLGILPAILMTWNLEVRDHDVLRSPVEWSWAGSLNDLVMPAMFYGMAVVADDRGPFEPERELALLEEQDVTITGGPPTAYRFILGHPKAGETDLSSLRVLALGGEAAGQTLVGLARDTLPDAVVHEVYGQSEAPLFASDCEALGVPHREGRMGKPAPGMEVRVADPETGDSLERGEVGELCLRYTGNPICFTGYLNRPEATAEKVRGGWMFSEDLGLIDEEGYLGFHSRRDDVILSSGYKVSPAEVEDTLSAHEAVANVGVIGVPDDERGELVKAFVVTTPEHEPSDDLRAELQTFVKDRLAKYEYPRALKFVDELPLTTTGKVRRKDLREREGIED